MFYFFLNLCLFYIEINYTLWNALVKKPPSPSSSEFTVAPGNVGQATLTQLDSGWAGWDSSPRSSCPSIRQDAILLKAWGTSRGRMTAREVTGSTSGLCPWLHGNNQTLSTAPLAFLYERSSASERQKKIVNRVGIAKPEIRSWACGRAYYTGVRLLVWEESLWACKITES